MVRDSHSILTRWRNHFSQILNVYGVNDIKQTGIRTYIGAISDSAQCI